MKNSFFYVFAVLVSGVVFFPLSASAQKSKKVDAKPVSAAAAKTLASKPQQQQPVSAVKTTSTAASPTIEPVSAMEQSVLDEINLIRKEPKKYIEYLEDYKKLFKGKTLYPPKAQGIITNEGTAAVGDAINYLKTVPPWLEAFKFSNGLNKCAAAQLKDLLIDSSISHKGLDGSDLPTRMKRFGMFGATYAENIAYEGETPRDIVLLMLIDDGWKSRSHRKNLLSPTFKVLGVACGRAKAGNGMCVLTFADSFTDGGGGPKTGVREY